MLLAHNGRIWLPCAVVYLCTIAQLKINLQESVSDCVIENNISYDWSDYELPPCDWLEFVKNCFQFLFEIQTTISIPFKIETLTALKYNNLTNQCLRLFSIWNSEKFWWQHLRFVCDSRKDICYYFFIDLIAMQRLIDLSLTLLQQKFQLIDRLIDWYRHLLWTYSISNLFYEKMWNNISNSNICRRTAHHFLSQQGSKCLA